MYLCDVEAFVVLKIFLTSFYTIGSFFLTVSVENVTFCSFLLPVLLHNQIKGQQENATTIYWTWVTFIGNMSYCYINTFMQAIARHFKRRVYLIAVPSG